MENQCRSTKFIIAYPTLLFCLISFVFAQEPNIQWFRSYGVDGWWTEAFSVQQTNDRGYIIAGFTGEESYQQQVWLLKTDSLGEIIWSNAYGGVSYDYGCEVLQAYDKGYVVVGYADPLGGGLSDVCLVKTDSLGQLLWTRNYGDTGDDRGFSVQQVSDGGYIIAGSTYDAYGDPPPDVYLIKADSIGDTVWTKRYGGSFWDHANSVRQTADQGYVVVGMTVSFGAGNGDIWVLKTDAFGDTLWTRTFGGAGHDEGCDIQLTADGGYVIAGWTESYSVEGSKIYLIKTDYLGNVLWEHTYGQSGGDVALSIRQTFDLGYILTGWCTSSYSWHDIVIMKTDQLGDMLWMQVIPLTLYDDWCRSIQQTADGGYVAVGLTSSSGVRGLVMKLEPDFDTLGNITPERAVFGMPNPFSGSTIVHYRLPCMSRVRIAIYNAAGQKVLNLTDAVELAGMHMVCWNGTNDDGVELPAGVYLCCMETDVFATTEKIIKLK